MIRHPRQATAQERLHDDGRDVPFVQLAVEVFRIHVARGGVLPVEVVELDLHEVPRNAHVEHVVEHLHVPMEGPAQVADPSLGTLLQHEVEHAILDVAILEKLDAAASTDGVHQVVVQVVGLQVLQGLVEHGDRVLTRIVAEVRHLGGQVVGLARMATQGDARSLLRHTLHIDRGSVEIVHAMLDGIVHEAVHLLLVDHILAIVSLLHRPSHTAIAQEGNTIPRRGILSVGHLVGRHLAQGFRGRSRLTLGTTPVEGCGRSDRTSTHHLQEVAAVHLLLFHSICFSVELILQTYSLSFGRLGHSFIDF